jgi:hypothetical protein
MNQDGRQIRSHYGQGGPHAPRISRPGPSAIAVRAFASSTRDCLSSNMASATHARSGFAHQFSISFCIVTGRLLIY